jgi:NAD(P)-dependent dehydrogenase (short-subunit alcohol dehydrogenase family)
LAERAALVTGGSSGIGLAIARALGEDGYGVTVASRRPQKLEAAANELRSAGIDVQAAPANMTEEQAVAGVVQAHRERFGRLDVLVNNAGVGIGEAMEGITTKYLDMQLGVNLRAVVIGTREGLPMLREAGAEHGKALIVNLASIAGKVGQAWLSVYSATKAGVIGFSQATQKEVAGQGIQVTALCPAFVDTPMTEFAKEQVNAEEMIRPEDIAESVRFLLVTSPACLVPEIVFTRPDDQQAA